MNQYELQESTSFLLGLVHGGIVQLLQPMGPGARLSGLEKLEAELRKDIERLYYPSPVPTSLT